ncbi:hypothetical protein QN277_027184 [Acacia crassicarpa]|uniref:EF-hand domain-containing protein n=1 Tax=Acacia crassicarpa TaxID=499986 RepID=A0AAE1JDQ6_9FABA|nr:hypothetical protein QN277_027184 [Acacia crassicarpa]
MEEIRKAAKAVYDNWSDEEKKEMEDLFRSVDKNGDGKITLREFMASNNNTCTAVLLRNLFELVDQNGDGILQFDEFVTLVYLASSSRPSCDGCGHFIGGLFFTCTQCYLGNKGVTDTYDLCIPCYHGGEFVHEHTDFVDNYSLLAMMRKALSSESEEISSSQSSDGSRREKEKVKKSFRRFTAILGLAANVAQFL